ncbi:ImmA/IrrE family metallo-endopeptidase [Glycocaulis albus]|nr:ImmA/IrrE family metallo-endopeptidase [Glycocaulis albus]
MLTAELNIRLFNLRSFLANVDYSKSINVPEFDVEMEESPRAVAKKVRLHWQLTRGPVKNLTRLLERAGVIVGVSDFGGAQISGVMFRPPSAPPIMLYNPKHPADRVRFTLAHELGHLVMHRFPTSSMESEANEFASEFMMPSDEMRQIFRGRKLTVQYLAALKKEWRMSMQSLLMSARNVGAVDDNKSRYLFSEFSKRGWRTREPAELDFPNDEPVVLSDIIKIHLNDLGYTFDELLGMTKLYKEEFESLYGRMDGGDLPTMPRLRIIN